MLDLHRESLLYDHLPLHVLNDPEVVIQVQPDPEDNAIRVYLDEHELIPKTQGTDLVDGQEFDVMVFGGCYLDHHLEVIEDMQRQVVIRERLTVEIEHILRKTTDSRTRSAIDHMPEPQLKMLIAHLVQEV